MVKATTGKKLTLEEFLALPEGDVNYEFVDGYAVPKGHQNFFIQLYKELYCFSFLHGLKAKVAPLQNGQYC